MSLLPREESEVGFVILFLFAFEGIRSASQERLARHIEQTFDLPAGTVTVPNCGTVYTSAVSGSLQSAISAVAHCQSRAYSIWILVSVAEEWHFGSNCFIVMMGCAACASQLRGSAVRFLGISATMAASLARRHSGSPGGSCNGKIQFKRGGDRSGCPSRAVLSCPSRARALSCSKPAVAGRTLDGL